ncbi:polysaccharide pyruvyl transferase family protein [Nonlabens sp. Ci31]|uniref:polysaccharide pyruvyl transferase family protein n=1 Tax=Nonlabens sp. Ci31 TaxID=2608253 RepID=UPI0014647F8F|nr:polysaccharide pyruvyl transferase family protein [Nonlabens sp. Ci31]QJP33001.1 polysaccharide pyruvyl transferase family protein [Nonlabens sp. Ci31]
MKIMNKIWRRFKKLVKPIALSKKPEELQQIISYSKNETPLTLVHVSAFNYGNAGDVLLPIVLQDTWQHEFGKIDWINQKVYSEVDIELVNRINESNGVVIGGGGLFLRDTNPNEISGWQWPCSIEMLNQIKVPVILYAVGYNRFRGQEEFEPFFTENICAFAEKATYIGLRNYGSINAIENYLPERLHNKLRFQPCMTTFIAQLYPNEFNYDDKQNFIAFNAAFDRSHLRFGEKIGDILSKTAQVLKELSIIIPIKFYSHLPSDDAIIPFLQSYEVPFELVNLHQKHPKEIIEAYVRPKLVIGMRGHAQMIPFGCKTPILSIVSHDKLQWFLDDIGKPEWAVDVLSTWYKDELKSKALDVLSKTMEIKTFINEKQKELYQISIKNVSDSITEIKHKTL